MRAADGGGRLLKGIHSHNHRHAKVLRVLDLLLHVAAAFLQQLQVLRAQAARVLNSRPERFTHA